MNGHQQIIAMRRDGRKPVAVWITDGFDPMANKWHLEPNCMDGRMYASVQVESLDIPEALDLRFLVGMNVHVAGDRENSRTRRLYASVVAAKPRLAICIFDAEILFHG